MHYLCFKDFTTNSNKLYILLHTLNRSCKDYFRLQLWRGVGQLYSVCCGPKIKFLAGDDPWKITFSCNIQCTIIELIMHENHILDQEGSSTNIRNFLSQFIFRDWCWIYHKVSYFALPIMFLPFDYLFSFCSFFFQLSIFHIFL